MTNEIITTLHPDNDKNTNLYPNIKKDNIPNKSIDTSKLDDNVLSMIGSLKPSGVDTSTNILAFTENKGIYVGSNTGHWYYWNGTQYVDGGIYQATEIPDGSISYNKTDFIDGITNILDLNDTDTIIKSGYFCTDVNYPNGSANSSYAFVRCKVMPNTTYTIRGWFYFALINSNGLFTYSTNLGQSQLVNKTFTTGSDTKYVLFNTTPSALSTSMIVDGETYPEQYYDFGTHYLFKGTQEYVRKNQIENLIEKYYVGATRQYTTFTQCIRALANNTNKKIIYIDEGVYDIFNEIGGSTYALSITQGTSWIDCNDIIPDNTTIIGLGDVTFNFMPTAEQIGNIADDLLSPINVQGNVTIENITINADNCRYCIHDETGDGYENSVKNYKNVKCYKYASGGLGKTQAYASGFYKGVSFNFENCYFQSPVSCISFHDRNFNGGNININNCAFVSTSGSINNASISFGNVAYSQHHQKVYINNCYISSKIHIYAENGNEHINSFDLQLIGCNNPTISLQDVLTTNIYTPKIYN